MIGVGKSYETHDGNGLGGSVEGYIVFLQLPEAKQIIQGCIGETKE